MIFRLDQSLVHLNGIPSPFVETILTSTSTGLINQQKAGVSRIKHIMLKICRSEQDNACNVENVHCRGFTLFILFYSFKGIMLNLCLFSFTHSTPYPLAGFRLLLQLLVEHPFCQLVMTTSEDFLCFQNAFYS